MVESEEQHGQEPERPRLSMLARVRDRISRVKQIVVAPPAIEGAALLRGPLTTDGASLIEVRAVGWGRLIIDGKRFGVVWFKPKHLRVVLRGSTTIEVRNLYGVAKKLVELETRLPVLAPLLQSALTIASSRSPAVSLPSLNIQLFHLPKSAIPTLEPSVAIGPLRRTALAPATSSAGLSPIRRIRFISRGAP